MNRISYRGIRAVAIAFATSLAACGTSAGSDGANTDSTPGAALQNDKSSLALPVVGDTVIKGDLVISVNATGTIRSDATATVKSETAGTVSEVLIRPGSYVEKDQVMVRLDTKPLELALERAQAAVNNARARYRAEIEPDSVVSGQPPSDARRAFARASAGLDGAEVDLREAKLNLERAEIKAPFAGRIENVEVAVGERVNSGSEIATVVDIVHLRVEARVMESDIPLLKANGDAEVTIPAIPGKTIGGRIAAVLPLVDSTLKTGTAIVQLRGDGALRPGMFAKVKLEANRFKNEIIVPQRAIVERNGRPLVFVVKDNQANWVYVNPGRSNGEQVAILPDSVSGLIPLKPGDIVLVEGHLTLSHQAPVRLVNPSENQQQ